MDKNQQYFDPYNFSASQNQQFMQMPQNEMIARLRAWYRELGLPQNMQELGIPADADFAAMADAACKVYGGGAAVPTLPGVHPVTAGEAAAIYQSAT